MARPKQEVASAAEAPIDLNKARRAVYAREAEKLRDQVAANYVAMAQPGSRLSPHSGISKPRTTDPTEPEPEIQKYLSPGCTQKWVPETSGIGDNSGFNFASHLKEGFVPVLDADGNRVTGPFGVLMEIPITAAVRREFDRMPEGSIEPSRYWAAHARRQLGQQAGLRVDHRRIPQQNEYELQGNAPIDSVGEGVHTYE